MKRPLTTRTTYAIDVTTRRQQPGSGEAGTPPDRVDRAAGGDVWMPVVTALAPRPMPAYTLGPAPDQEAYR